MALVGGGGVQRCRPGRRAAAAPAPISRASSVDDVPGDHERARSVEQERSVADRADRDPHVGRAAVSIRSAQAAIPSA